THRDQFVYVADVAPTIYELIGTSAPTTFRGVEQTPVTGNSFTSLLAEAAAPATTTVQYFEMAGSRALVRDGWKAVCKHTKGADYDTEPWELYHLAEDPSECRDLATERPELLDALVQRWWEEAEAHGVLPLDDRLIELFGVRYRDHSPHPADRRYVYRPAEAPMPAQACATLGGRGFELTATVTRAEGDEGVLYAAGTENSGITVFVQDDRLVLDYNAFDDHTVLVSNRPVPTGDSELTLQVERDGMSGTATMRIDGETCGTVELPLLMRIMSSVGASVGRDHGSAVSPRYTAPFVFSGELHQVVIQLAEGRAPDVEAAEAAKEMSRQ
ncbi:MAG: arylsulfatase, partial [Microthrixaceae bacterium]